MKQGSLRVAKGALAVIMSFTLVGTMGNDLVVVKENGEQVLVHHEERALPEKFRLEPIMEVEDFNGKKKKSNAKTKVLVRPKNINKRYL